MEDEPAQKDRREESLHAGLGSRRLGRSCRIEKLEKLTALFEARVRCVVVVGFKLKGVSGEQSCLLPSWKGP